MKTISKVFKNPTVHELLSHIDVGQTEFFFKFQTVTKYIHKVKKTSVSKDYAVDI